MAINSASFTSLALHSTLLQLYYYSPCLNSSLLRTELLQIFTRRAQSAQQGCSAGTQQMRGCNGMYYSPLDKQEVRIRRAWLGSPPLASPSAFTAWTSESAGVHHFTLHCTVADYSLHYKKLFLHYNYCKAVQCMCWIEVASRVSWERTELAL